MVTLTSWLATSRYSHRLVALVTCDSLIICYLWRVLARTATSRARMLVVLPIVGLNCLLPTLFPAETEILTVVSVAFTHTWLANFKVVALALGRGPLIKQLTPIQFVIALWAPITPQIVDQKGIPRVGSVGRLELTGGSSWQLLQRFVLKTAALVAVVRAISIAPPGTIVLDALWAGGLYLFLGSLMDGPASLLTAAVGLRIAPHFNNPFVSESIASFWGTRWNLTASNTLRYLVYDSICDGRWTARPASKLPARGPRALRALALCACFLVSGAVHEVMFWYAAPRRMTGRWFAFFAIQAYTIALFNTSNAAYNCSQSYGFIVSPASGDSCLDWKSGSTGFSRGQGPLVLLETAIHRQLRRRGVNCPHPLKVAVTVTILMTLAHFLFFPPAVELGIAENVSASIRNNFVELYGYLKTFKYLIS